MKFDGRHFRIEAILEAPMWVLVVVFIGITLSVILTSIGLF